MSHNKRPSFQFYPSDWRADSSLQICSLKARGLWVEILCLMHEIGQREGARYGFLELEGKRLGGGHLARLVGIEEKQVCVLLDELQEAGVFSRDENGVIYSRRLVRDGELKQIRSKAGSKGGSKSQAKAKQKPSKAISKSPLAGARTEDEDEEEEERDKKKESAERKKEEDELVQMFHKLCPSFPSIRKLTKSRRAAIAARAKEGVSFQELFEKAEASDFLAGRTNDFRADLSWLLNPENCNKTLEGKYDNRSGGTKADRDYARAFD